MGDRTAHAGRAFELIWEGHLPTALATAVGIIVLYTLLVQTAERRAGAYAVGILATTPAWFVHTAASSSSPLPLDAMRPAAFKKTLA